MSLFLTSQNNKLPQNVMMVIGKDNTIFSDASRLKKLSGQTRISLKQKIVPDLMLLYLKPTFCTFLKFIIMLESDHYCLIRVNLQEI
jgi:hypothetical protein